MFTKYNGTEQLKKFGPFNAIHVGIVVEEVPDEFLDLLDYNGRLFALVGENEETQKILL